MDDASMAGLFSLNIVDMHTTPAESLLNEDISGSMDQPGPNHIITATDFLDMLTDYEGSFLHPREPPPLPNIRTPLLEEALSADRESQGQYLNARKSPSLPIPPKSL
jgi:hypothetical protein